MSELNFEKARVFMIDKETGKQHELEGLVEVTHLGDVLLPGDVLPKNFDLNAPKEYTWTLKLSKRKGRKFNYAMQQLCHIRPRKYYSKREILDWIIREWVHKKKFVFLDLPKEELLRQRTHKQFVAMCHEIEREYNDAKQRGYIQD